MSNKVPERYMNMYRGFKETIKLPWIYYDGYIYVYLTNIYDYTGLYMDLITELNSQLFTTMPLSGGKFPIIVQLELYTLRLYHIQNIYIQELNKDIQYKLLCRVKEFTGVKDRCVLCGNEVHKIIDGDGICMEHYIKYKHQKKYALINRVKLFFFNIRRTGF